MQLTLADEQVAVFDDVLSPADWDAVFGWADARPYRPVHADGISKIWRVNDGNPLVAEPVKYLGRAGAGDTSAYPTFTPVDVFVRAVLEATAAAPGVVGDKESWTGFGVSPWVYPRGSGLALHIDGPKFTGAYVYFLHREWKISWGGMLVVLDPRTAPRTPPKPLGEDPPWLSDATEHPRVFDPGLGRVILAKPNRLVLIAAGAQHVVTKVDDAAGENLRVSLAGFFRKP